MRIDPTFALANQLEAGLWITLAVITAIRGRSKLPFVVAAALLLFGISDLVEARTGAWYDPWWLLAWKAACLFAILLVGISYKRRRFLDKLSTCSR
jgi:hypothetical protein